MAGNSKYDGCLGSVVFWGWIISMGLFKNYSTTIFIVGVSAIVVFFFVQFFAKKRCPHGVYNGEKIKSGTCKCPKCQEENILRRQEYEENRKKIEHQNQLEAQYKKQLSAAIKMKREILLSSSSTLADLSPFDFEDYMAELLKKLGYNNIIQTPYSNDGGKDIICSYEGKTYYVECKHYNKSNKVSRPQLQKLFAAMTEDSVNNGIFVTTSSFTLEALEYGQKYHIRTIDGNELAEIIAKQFTIYDYPVEYTLPCPKCGCEVAYRYLDEPTSKACPNGHIVNSIPSISLFPKKKHKYRKSPSNLHYLKRK